MRYSPHGLQGSAKSNALPGFVHSTPQTRVHCLPSFSESSAASAYPVVARVSVACASSAALQAVRHAGAHAGLMSAILSNLPGSATDAQLGCTLALEALSLIGSPTTSLVSLASRTADTLRGCVRRGATAALQEHAPGGGGHALLARHNLLALQVLDEKLLAARVERDVSSARAPQRGGAAQTH